MIHNDQTHVSFSPQPSSSPTILTVLIISFLFIWGCGGAPMKYQSFERMPPRPTDDVNKELQQQLMIQAAKSSLTDYRDYKVGPEDLLGIAIESYGQGRPVSEEESMRERRVNGQGEITMPLVGVVRVGGLTTEEIEQRLKELYGANYLRNPQITVTVKEFAHKRVAVTGAVTKPGYYDIIGPRSLLEVLAMAGGIANEPRAIQAGDVIHVIRPQKSVGGAKTMKTGSTQSFSPQTNTTVINLRQLVSGKAPELNLTVQAGDVVYVPFAGNAYVLGGVKKPGNVPVKQNLTVSQAIAMAGGVEPLLGTYDITLMRFDNQGKPLSIQMNLNRIAARKDPDIPVQDNDVILVKVGEVKRAFWILRKLLPIPTGGYSLSAL
ncbi:MAG: polysaccharide export protein [Syntrophobacterales bacterium]